MVKEMLYEENTYLTLTPRSGKGVKVTQNVDQYPQLHVTYAPAKFDVATSMVKERCIYQKIHYLTLTLGSRSCKMLPSTLDIV